MKYIIIALTILFANNAHAYNPYEMDCAIIKRVLPEVKRCENDEVICYFAGKNSECFLKQI